MRHRVLSFKLVAIVVGMFGFGYALVPLYNVLCDVTGLNGRTSLTADTVTENPDPNRSIRMEFLASVDPSAPFEFKPAVASMQITPGKIYRAEYVAHNLRDQPMISQSVPSIAPGDAAEYLKKIQCFCFTQQEFGPDEQRNLEVTFLVEPELPISVDTMSLSYTMFALEK
jgi:cytochrome c oxidase assembly protein subunit 11